MKFVKIISICLAVCVLLSACSSTKTDKSTTMSENTTGNTDAVKTYSQEQLDALNACYEPIVDCQKNGFDKEKAEELKPILKKALENGVTVDLYRNSNFYDKINDVSFSDIPIQDGLNDVSVAPVCYDAILAVYLGCVYATEPENFEKELEFLKKGLWILEPIPQFVYFFNYSYDISVEELKSLVDTVLSFSEKIESADDRYHTELFAVNMPAIYIHNNSTSEDFSEVNDIVKHVLAVSSETKKDTKNNDLNKVWIGYGDNYLTLN